MFSPLEGSSEHYLFPDKVGKLVTQQSLKCLEPWFVEKVDGLLMREVCERFAPVVVDLFLERRHVEYRQGLGPIVVEPRGVP